MASPSFGARTVAQQYDRLACVYDGLFGSGLQAGRVEALEGVALGPEDDVLEVGVGTGLTLSLYPSRCRVTGIDVSRRMLDRAACRLRSCGTRRIRLVEMDAARMAFADASFSLVYAAYVLTAVPEPLTVVREMARVCAPGGHVVFLNHFLSRDGLLSWCERRLSAVTERVGFRTDLALDTVTGADGLQTLRVARVGTPPLWSVVVCRKQ